LARPRVPPFPTRRSSDLFAKAFPPDYIRLIMAEDYQPDTERLMDDYLAFNPTRNRALDMLPLFATLAPQKVARACADALVKPRPDRKSTRLNSSHVKISY